MEHPDFSGTTDDLYAVSFVDDSYGWAVGSGGTILATSNGGATWSRQISHTTYTLETVTATSLWDAWVGGDYGTVLATSSGGNVWTG